MTTAEQSRLQLRAGLLAQRERQHAARILEAHRLERRVLRDAKRDVKRSRAGLSAAALAERQRADEGLLAARRRDEYRAALSYPMTAEELLAACVEALSAARLPDDIDRQETLGILMAHVIGRYGPQPIRADIGREWLRERAARIYQRECFRRERATGLRASAALSAAWIAEDADSDSDSGPDAVWYLAANTPAPQPQTPLSPLAVAERLQLSAKQTDALALALDSAQRVTLALSGAERKAATDARAILRKRFRDIDALRYALRPMRACSAAVDAALLIAAERASLAALGSHLSGGIDSASAERQRAAIRPARQPAARPLSGPVDWIEYRDKSGNVRQIGGCAQPSGIRPPAPAPAPARSRAARPLSTLSPQPARSGRFSPPNRAARIMRSAARPIAERHSARQHALSADQAPAPVVERGCPADVLAWIARND